MIVLGDYNYLWNVFLLFVGAFVVLFASIVTEKRTVMVTLGALFAAASLILTVLQYTASIQIQISGVPWPGSRRSGSPGSLLGTDFLSICSRVRFRR